MDFSKTMPRHLYLPFVLSGLFTGLAVGQAIASILPTASIVQSLTGADSLSRNLQLFVADSTAPGPAILIQTTEALAAYTREIEAFVSAGYAVVFQNLPEQENENADKLRPFPISQSTLLQSRAMLEWIAGQPWCNGSIGGFGRGTSAFPLLLLAGSSPPQLTTLYLIACPSSLYDDVFFAGGAFRQALAENWLRPRNLEQALPLVGEHHAYDVFWEDYNALHGARALQVPVALVTGWYDAFLQGTLRVFTATRGFAANFARENVRLLIGPWTDNQDGFGKRRQGGIIFPKNAEKDILADAVLWFDRWLKGGSMPIMLEPPVQYYLMGAAGEPFAPGNVWQTAVTWPPESKRVRYFLKKNGELGTVPDEKDTAEGYRYNPAEPVPTIGGANVHLAAGPIDQQDIEQRPDVLLFTTPPLSSSVAIAGRVSVQLSVTSSTPDTDFTAKLTDVYPDGRSMLVADGILRMRFRESNRSPALLRPGRVYEIEIDLGHTAMVFNAGHRIRLAVSSSNHPRFQANPNSPFGFARNRQQHVAVNTVFYGGRRDSALLLPVIDLK